MTIQQSIASKTLRHSPCWQALQAHQQQLSQVTLAELFQQDTQRGQQYQCRAAGLTLDFSKNHVNQTTLELLLELAKQADMPTAIQQLLDGEPINHTEQRKAWHSLLRCPDHSANSCTNDSPEAQAVQETFARVGKVVDAIHQQQWLGFSDKPVTDVVNLGIGGSDLGPLMATSALKPYHQDGIRCHFVSNIDANHLLDTIAPLNPETTLFIVASKSFTTLETLTNARTARQWLLQAADASLGANADGVVTSKHFIAVTAHPQKAEAFGIRSDNIYPMWDWVGGRFSLWSAIGLPIAVAVGMDNFNRLRHGAGLLDEHFHSAPLEQNLPVLFGLLGVWYSSFWQYESHAVLPYDHHLRHFPDFLQQLDMESNGKSVTKSGQPVEGHTGPIVWGKEGTIGQHSFHQLLHQGTRKASCDFIIPLKPHHDQQEHHRQLFANCLSQSQALLMGRSLEQATAEFVELGYSESEAKQLAPHKVISGNRPSNTITMAKLTPETLGALIALYEHKVYVQSVIWDINPFDQWGVELGKQMSSDIAASLQDDTTDNDNWRDSSTQTLIDAYRNAQG